jgi:diguanylate cyclase (GGDEF)-like protein
MSFLSDISFRRGIGLLLIVIAVLTGGTWMTVKLTTDSLVDQYVTRTAGDWAHFLASNVTDLENIAAGEQPSAASIAFFDGTRKGGQVFRYVIFNREGYSQLIVDNEKIAPVDLSEYNAEAARAIAESKPIINIKSGKSANFPASFAEAYVPALVGKRPVAVVAAYVDEGGARAKIYSTFLLAAVSLCLLTVFAFAIPAVAWYFRTREKQQADRRIRFMAHHDALTGLDNRSRLIERLDGALAVLPSVGGHVAAHFIDLDRFKEVNDTFGHDGGDFLLNTIGQRLRLVTRMEDLVARLGGDEFVVVQLGVSDREQAEACARRIASALSAPIFYKEQDIKANVTIGVALAPADGKTSERLLKSADLALYDGKAAGRDCVRFFRPEMDEALQARLALEKMIRGAIANNGLVLHYQPVFEISGKHLVGFEALVRLSAEDGTLIPPTTFIPVAEDMRVMDKLGAWVLREACRTAKTWPNNLTVAVNLSPTQFEAGSIAEIVSGALKESGLQAQRLELEITESLLLGNSEQNMAQLHELKTIGVSIAMDDFGTGYSSLSYLWKFPFDKIKIDRSFMQGFDGTDHDAETVVKTIIALGRELHMRVTVEGVETADQADFLHGADADQVQGFYFGRPMPESEIAPILLKDLQDKAGSQTKRAELKAKRKAVS